MKKWIGLGIALFVVILASSYCGMGFITERILKKSILALSQSPNVIVEIKNYKRGWFQSKADLEWTLKVPQKPHTTYGPHSLASEKIYHINIPLTVFHGPIQFTNYKPWLGLGYATSKIILPPVYEQQFQPAAGEKAPQVDLSIFVDYLAKTTLKLEMPNFKLMSKEGDGTFEWLGMDANLIVSSNRDQVKGQVSLKGFSWLKDGLKGIHGPIHGDFNMRLGMDHLYIGTTHLSLPSIFLMKNNQQLASITEGEFNSSSDVINGLYKTSLSIRMEKALSQNRHYGAGDIEINVSNIDAHTLVIINKKLNQSTGSEIDRQRMFLSILSDLPMLLSKGAELQISHLALNLPEGKVNATLKFNWPKEQVTNPLQFFQKMTGEGQLRVSSTVLSHWINDYVKQKFSISNKLPLSLDSNLSSTPLPLVDPNALIDKRTQDKIQELIQLGVLTIDGSDYVLIFKFLNGRLFINERPFAPSMIAI